MHELSLCGAIADIATRRAGPRRIEAVHVRIGELRQVVPDTLSFCWELVVAQTDLDGSLLRVERVEARLGCRACGSQFGLADPPVFACASCGGLDVEVVAGEEFDVDAIDLAPG